MVDANIRPLYPRDKAPVPLKRRLEGPKGRHIEIMIYKLGKWKYQG